MEQKRGEDSRMTFFKKTEIEGIKLVSCEISVSKYNVVFSHL